jgi:ribonuclease inhibitor
MKHCIMDGRVIGSLDDLYDQVTENLKFPEHFGRNLDALQDVLSVDIEGPIDLVWEHADLSRKSMSKEFDRVVKILRKLEKTRDDFTFTIYNP